MGDLLQTDLHTKSDVNDGTDDKNSVAKTPKALDSIETSRTDDRSEIQERILRHHDKIIRAKNINHNARQILLNEQQQEGENQLQSSGKIPAMSDSDEAKVVSGEGDGSANKLSKSTATSTVASKTHAIPSPTSNVTTNAVPPPQLVSALRQIFGTSSSSNLQDLEDGICIDEDEDTNNKSSAASDDLDDDGAKKCQQSENVNVLPSLLSAVLNHETFVGLPAKSESSPKIEKKPSAMENEAVNQIRRDLKNFFGADFGGDDENDNDGEGETSNSKDDDGASESKKAGLDVEDVSTPPPQLPPSAANMEAIIGSVCKGFINSSDKPSPTKSNVHGALIAILSILTGCLLPEEDLENLGLGDSHLLLQHQHLSTSTLDGAINDDSSFLQVGAVLSMLESSIFTSASNIVNQHDKNVINEFSLDEKLLDYFADASSTYEERIEIQKSNLFSVIPSPKLTKSDDETQTPMGLPPLVGRVSNSSDESDADEIDIDQSEVNRENSEDTLGNNDVPIFDEGGNEGQNDNSRENSDDMHEGDYHSDGDEDSEINDEEEEDEESIMLRQALALSLAAALGNGAADDLDADEGGNENDSDSAPTLATIGELEKSDDSEKGSIADNLPSLPTPPPISRLPKHSKINTDMHEQEDVTEIDKSNSSESEPSSVFDPSSLSSFGNLPTSHVLLHLQKIVLGIMQNSSRGNSNEISSELETIMSPGGMGSPFFGPQTPSLSSAAKSHHHEATEYDTFDNTAPDSVTMTLLFASLHLSNYLRNSAVAMLSDIVQDTEEVAEEYHSDVQDIDQDIKIADSNESEDPLPDKDDPAVGVASLESKGMQRKAAAAAHFATLRHETKQKVTLFWCKQVSLYSTCCLFSMRCLRIFMGQCIQHEISSVGGEDAVCMSTRMRLGLAAILSNFYSSSTSSTFEQLQHSVNRFSEDFKAAGNGPKNEFLVASLCSEAILLWGASASLLYPDHAERVSVLSELVSNRALPSAKSLLDIAKSKVDVREVFRWNDSEIQRSKLDLLCNRLRMSDMLHCFIESPMLSFGKQNFDDDQSSQLATQTHLPVNSLSTISLLCDVMKDYSEDDTITKLYLALCNRTMSTLLLWQNLSITSNDENDHDISGGESSTLSSEPWANSLQLSLNSSKFPFDSTKCADSIAIVSSASVQGVTANQRATKVWGTVLSTACFLPKSGIHRWAVKLEKCERGHVFVGVATSSASTKTYVGGDKHGWGLIGTQALWHDRNKIRSDYGSTFRSGATIVVTLDTNVGTLRYGLWKTGDSPSDSAPLSPSHGMLASPRAGSNSGSGGSMIEDWGIAFEGLPLDVKLYPAVGLYQRDDKATLYAVSNPTTSTSGKSASQAISSGDIYFPLPADHKARDHDRQVQRWNLSLCTDGITFGAEVLSRSNKLLSSLESASSLENDVLLTSVLPSLASSICLVPSCIPTLSTKYAISLLPHLTRCAKLLDKIIPLENKTDALGSELKEGKWLIRVEPSSSDSRSNIKSKEYTVMLEQCAPSNDADYICFRGEGNDTSKCARDESVTITGACLGSHLHLIEDWINISTSKATTSCIIDARLGLDGTKFEGTYHESKQHTSGQVFGCLQESVTRGSDTEMSGVQLRLLQTIESLLCMAIGHLSLILSSKTSLADIDRSVGYQSCKADYCGEKRELITKLITSSSIIAGGRQDTNANCINEAIDSLVEKKEHEEGNSFILQHWRELIALNLTSTIEESSGSTLMSVEKARTVIEQLHSLETDYGGSLSRLCPDEYSVSQQKIASVILYHLGFVEGDESGVVMDNALKALNTSRQILENGIRDALAQAKGLPLKQECKVYCSHACNVADFLFEFGSAASLQGSASLSVFDDVTLIFKSIKTREDLKYIRTDLDSITKKSVMRYLGLRSLQSPLDCEGSTEGIKLHSAIESVIASLPRLLRQPTASLEAKHNHNYGLSSIHSGCSAQVQKFITASMKTLYERVGICLEDAVGQKSSSLALSLLANCFAVSHPSCIENVTSRVIACIGDILVRCRKDASLHDACDNSPSVTTLVSALRRRSAHCVLQVAASVSLVITAQLSSQQESDETTDLVRITSDLLLREMTEMIPVVSESTNSRMENKALLAMKADWCTSRNLSTDPPRSSLMKCESSPGLSFLLNQNNYMMASKADSSEPMSSRYLGQLIDLLHIAVGSPSFIKHMSLKSKDWLITLFSFAGIQEEQSILSPPIYLQPKLRLRILRSLRLLLVGSDADSAIIRHLFRVVRPIVVAASDGGPSGFATNEAAVSLVRYLHSFSDSWRQIIHQVMEEVWKSNSESQSSDLRFGNLSFLGGAPGYLTKGSFVVVKPSLASSTSAGSTKDRVGNSGTSTLNVSNGNGIDEIVSSLSRHFALAGILSSVDLKSGSCDVVVVGNRDMEKSSNVVSTEYSLGSKMTIRAVRANMADVSFVAELPLLIKTDIPVHNMYESLLRNVRSVSSSILSKEDKKCDDLVNSDELLSCAMGIRSTTILTSDRNILHDFVSSKQGCIKEFLAACLQLACPENIKATGSRELSSLPGLEALLWHLLSVRSTLISRKDILESASPSQLNALFGQSGESTKKSGNLSSSKKDSSRTPSTIRSLLGSLAEGEGSNANTSSRNMGDEGESDSAAARNEGNDDSSDTAAAHLREAAIVQMAELGLPRQWAELALRRVGGTNIEAAVHFCLERGGEMERLIAEDNERRGTSSMMSSSRRRGYGSSRMDASHLIRQLVEMGFPRRWCVEALSATRNNVDEALTWILTNGERLSAEDEAAEEENDDDDDDDDDDDENDDDYAEEEEEENDDDLDENNEDESVSDDVMESSAAIELSSEDQDTVPDSKNPLYWSGSLCPVRFVSGRSNINPKTLEITGLSSGGFSSVGTKGVLLTSGKWYYEAEIQTAGCLQIGWADSSFAGHCQADRGDGVGDGPSSWAFDGWRRYRWHSTPTEWGCRWAEGDVVGCLVDMDSMAVSFTLNGKGEEIGMGLAYSGDGFRPCSGVYACVSFNRKEKIRLILGGKGTEPFKFSPPEGYRGVGEAVHDAVNEMDSIMENENILDNFVLRTESDAKRYICDFSDGEHGHELFAWQHRYYGADASVHLGASRAGVRGGNSLKSLKSGSSSGYDNPVSADISSRLAKAFADSTLPDTDDIETDALESSVEILETSYDKLLLCVEDELKEVCASLCVLYAQKLAMHTIVSCSDTFSLDCFLPDACNTVWKSENAEEEVSRMVWKIIEHFTSLRSSGWVGEAGAMAVAAEALGLGISTFDNSSTLTAPGLVQVNDEISIPCGGTAQFLNSALFLPNNVVNEDATIPSFTFAACSELSFGSNAGGHLSFVRKSLQSAVVKSTVFREVLVAAVRQAIRLIAAVEFDSDEHSSENDSSNMAAPNDRKRLYSDENAPDARLASFFTGLLLSEPVKDNLTSVENTALRCSLFEGWCVGLLSASPPWRMISCLTAAGILSTCPVALSATILRVPVLAKFFSRLESTVSRRYWAERAAAPICSRYSHALIELLASVKRSIRICDSLHERSPFCQTRVDAATPLPFVSHGKPSDCDSWEWSDGWVGCNDGWEVWTGSVVIMEVEWKSPTRSIVRTLMDGGEGPPLLREGCTVVRGSDWDNRDEPNNDDGKDKYDEEKQAKDDEKRALDEEKKKQKELERKASEDDKSKKDVDPADDEDPAENPDDVDPAIEEESPESNEPPDVAETPAEEDKVDESNGDIISDSEPKKKKLPTPKLPTGTVLSIEPWEGIPGMARRVRWHRTGKEDVYRYGGNGGRFDLVHVETNEKNTRIKKRHPPPESLEQCAARYGFGKRRKCNVILRLSNRKHINANNSDIACDGILEWPDFGAGIHVECTIYSDGAVSVKEKSLLYGSKDSGWETRFGQPSYVPGTEFVILPTLNADPMSSHEELLGDSTFLVKDLRRKEDGGRVRVTSELRLYRGKGWKVGCVDNTDGNEFAVSPMQSPLISFDPEFHASSFNLSKDRRTVTCVAADGRGIAYGNVGFTKGVHYWEVKLEKAEIGSVYIGVAEKPESTSGGFETQPRLNRWLGWGFVNFRATYSSGIERVYGAHCHAGDTVGVLLDCDAGRISYFFDGVKYGEHIINDLGCAFENVSPFGFNADGCGSGGAGQGAPSGVDGGRSGRNPANGSIRPKAMWPVIGLRHPGDRVTISSKCMTSHGVDAFASMKNSLAVDEVLCAYESQSKPQILVQPDLNPPTELSLPDWFVEESLREYNRWKSGRWLRTATRGSGQCKLSSHGLDVDLDTSPLACAAACASLGLPFALLCGDKVDVKRSSGRILELHEEAVVLGAYQGRLFYRLVAQKSEGGSLMEGGGRAWFWDESEAVEGGLQLIGEGRGRSVVLPKLNWFNPICGGLKVVYNGGAVGKFNLVFIQILFQKPISVVLTSFGCAVRSDLEIFDGSENLGNIPMGTIIPAEEIIERRQNSCGVARYLIDHEPIGRGWISGRIRGGKEESIVEVLPFSNDNDDEERSGEDETEQIIYMTPEESAKEWYKHYVAAAGGGKDNDLTMSIISESLDIGSVDEFHKLLSAGKVEGFNDLESDALVANVYSKLVDVLPHYSDGVECSFIDCATVLASASERDQVKGVSSIDANVHEVASESLVHVIDKLPSTKSLMARIAMLRALNRRAQVALPWLPMRPSQEGSCIFGGLHGFGASLERAGRTWDSNSSNTNWVQVSSIASRIRDCRELLFAGTKRTFLEGVMDATTTPTPLSNDEYELPRDVRTLRVNRLKARRAMASNDSNLKRKHSVFSQMQREMRGWGGATLRRGFVAKGHGGQKRAWKVKLVGEGVNDYSGPYREVFTDSMQEITDLDDNGCSSLGVLEPTANNQSEVGEGRDLFMFARPAESSSIYSEAKLKLDQLSSEEVDLIRSFSSIAHKKNESSREIEDALLYLGRLAGTACRHGIPVDLPLPLGMVWKHLAEESIDMKESLREIDLLAFRRSRDENNNDRDAALVTQELLATQRRLLNSFAEGISSVLPIELLSLFTGEQLRDIMCGNPDVDVEMLRRVTEYEGYKNDDEVISYFWEVLREMTTSERKLFLQFVWARNRLPLKESDFDAPFKIQKDGKMVQDDGDYPLPSASTCFFSLSLPNYPDKETLKRKLLFAIENVTTMETDYATNDVEVGEGWRGL